MERNNLLQNLYYGVRSLAGRWLSNAYHTVGLSTLQIKILKHLPGGQLRSRTILGQPLWFTSPTELIHGLKEIFIERIYEQPLPENAYILDCGANIGLSVIYLKQLCPSARIVAFEPDPANYALLERNVRSFGLNQVELVEAAIWKADTTLQFSSAGSMGSSIDTQVDGIGVQVKAIRLKHLLKDPVDFLKIDIEGAEYEVIRDAADSLQNVSRMFLEYHGRFDQNQELLEMLHWVGAAGFQFYIREAAPVHPVPFRRSQHNELPYDVQLNIFCFRD